MGLKLALLHEAECWGNEDERVNVVKLYSPPGRSQIDSSGPLHNMSQAL